MWPDSLVTASLQSLIDMTSLSQWNSGGGISTPDSNTIHFGVENTPPEFRCDPL